jgi:HK97 family phage major capsid protein
MTATLNPKLAELLTEIEQKSNAVRALFDKSDENGGDISDDDVKSVMDLNKEIEGLEHRAKALQEREGIRTANDARLDDLKKPASGGMRFPSGDGKGQRAEAIKSLGEQFTDADAFKAWREMVAPNGHFTDRMQLQSPAIPVKGLGAKALVTGASDTSGGAMVFNDVQAGITLLGRRPLTIRDIITIGQTTSDTVEFVRVTSETNAAAPTAEATAAGGSSGYKPESALALEKVTTPVKTIAHWIPATTRALSDAGQMRTLIDNFLRYGLEEELEDQIVGGDGTGENLTGIDNTSGIQTQAWDTNLLTTTRKARTKVRVVGRAQATAYLLHPYDWEAIDLLQDNEARYFFGGPSMLGNPRLWGLPVVESEGVTQGEGFVGDFRQCVLWDREQANIQVSNSHSDFFVRNLVAILAEMRAAFGILRPVAIVEMDLVA